MNPINIFCKGRPCLAFYLVDVWHCNCCGKPVKVIPPCENLGSRA